MHSIGVLVEKQNEPIKIFMENFYKNNYLRNVYNHIVHCIVFGVWCFVVTARLLFMLLLDVASKTVNQILFILYCGIFNG